MEKLLHQAKHFFTVRNSLIVVICILSLILIVQNVQRLSGHRPSHNFGGSVTNARGAGGLGGMRLPGVGGGFGTRRPGN